MDSDAVSGGKWGRSMDGRIIWGIVSNRPCTQQIPTDATVLVVAHRAPRSITRCGVSVRAVCAVRAVRCFVTPVASVISCVCVRALKGIRFELSTPNLVHTAHGRSACTDPEVKRSKVKVTREYAGR